MFSKLVEGAPHLQTFFQRPDHISSPLRVLTSIFDPMRYRRRWALYQDFARMVAASGAELWTVEVAFGERAFAVTQPDNPCHLQLRVSSHSLLWLKENALSLLVQRLPADWQYVAFLDADTSFTRSDWCDETLHALQMWPVVQCWSEAYDLTPEHEIGTRFRSFAWSYRHDIQPPPTGHTTYYARGAHVWHPGYAWAFRRQALADLGGLIDWSPLGNADTIMALALIGRLHSFAGQLGAAGQRWCEEWQDRAERYVRRNIGYVEGALFHYYHGSKQARQYTTRAAILSRAGFDVERDLKRDVTGLWHLNPQSIALRDGMAKYFIDRREDN